MTEAAEALREICRTVSGRGDVIRLLVKYLVVCVLAAVVVIVGLVAVGWTPRVEYFLALAVAVAVASTAVRTIDASIEPATWSVVRPPHAEVGVRQPNHVSRALPAPQR